MRTVSGIRERPALHAYTSPRHSAFQLNVILHGSITLRLPENDITLGPGEAYVLGYGAALRLRHGKEPFRAIYATMFGAEAEFRMEHRMPPSPIQVTPELRSIADLIESEACVPHMASVENLGHLAAVAINLAVRARGEWLLEQGETAAPDYWAERVRHALEASVFSGAPVRGALAGLGLSYRQLVRHFERATGMPPKRYQMRLRMDQARHLLSSSGLPITSIALDLGFPSPQRFAAAFREHTGMSPGQYRTQHRALTHAPRAGNS